jgi:hypothetical protein
MTDCDNAILVLPITANITKNFPQLNPLSTILLLFGGGPTGKGGGEYSVGVTADFTTPALRMASSISSFESPFDSKKDNCFDKLLLRTCGSCKNFIALSSKPERSSSVMSYFYAF